LPDNAGGEGCVVLHANNLIGSPKVISNSFFPPWGINGNPISGAGPSAANPFVLGPNGSFIDVPLLPDLFGGPAAYGLSATLPSARFPAIISGEPTQASVAVPRFDGRVPGYDYHFSGFDLVAIINLCSVPVTMPAFVSSNYRMPLVPLRQGGFAYDTT